MIQSTAHLKKLPVEATPMKRSEPEMKDALIKLCKQIRAS